jgi:hypothetical protein
MIGFTERDEPTTWAAIKPARVVASAVVVAEEKYDIAQRVYNEAVNYYLDNDEWDQAHLDDLDTIAKTAYGEMMEVKHAALNECSCLPDLPDGRVNGGRGGCCLVCEAEGRDDEIPWQWGPSNRSEFGGE